MTKMDELSCGVLSRMTPLDVSIAPTGFSLDSAGVVGNTTTGARGSL